MVLAPGVIVAATVAWGSDRAAQYADVQLSQSNDVSHPAPHSWHVILFFCLEPKLALPLTPL